MLTSIFYLLAQCIFYNLYHYTHSIPLIGINVRQSEVNEFPFAVPIKFINYTNTEPETDFICTGTIISRGFVLSISHTIKTVAVNRLEILFGSIDLREGTRFNISQLITYEMWYSSRGGSSQCGKNDISMLRLSNKLPREAVPVVLSPMPKANLYGCKVTTAGWGRTNVNAPSRFLQTVNLMLLTKTECKNRIERMTNKKSTVQELFFCTSATPFAFLRNGDSGGPLLYYGQMIGINKGTSPLAENNFNPGKVNIHVDIDCYRHFIADIKNNYQNV